MERIVELLTELNQITPTRDPEATTQELSEIIQDPSSIQLFLNIASSNPDAKIRKSAYVFIRKIAKTIKEPEAVLGMKEEFLNLFSTETDKTLFIYIIYCIEAIAKTIFEESVFPELTQVGMQMITNEETTEQGLNFMINLFEYMPEEDQQSTFDTLAQFCIEHFASENKEIRILSFDLLSELIFSSIIESEEEDADDLLIAKIPNIGESLVQIFTNAITALDQKEITSAITNLSNLFYDRYTCLEEVAKQCFQITLEAISNEEIPIEIRDIIVHLLDDGPDFYPDFFCENVQEYFTAAVGLSITACQANREDLEYLSPSTFISGLANCNFENEEFFPFIMQTASELAEGDEAQTMVAIQLISWIAASCADDINDDSDAIIELITQGLQSEDEPIAKAASSLLEEIAAKAPTAVSPHLDDLIDLLIARTQENAEYIVTLERVITHGDRCYSKLADLLQFLLAALSEEGFEYQENAIGCIAKALEKFTGTDETLFENIFPVISPFLESMSDIGVTSEVFLCIAALIKVSPASVQGSLETILPFIVENITTEEVNIFNCKAVTEALKGIISMFSVSIESEAPQIAQALLKLLDVENPKLSREIADEDSGDDDSADLAEREYFRMKQNAVVSLGMMIEVMKETIADLIPAIYQKMQEMVESGYVLDQMSAAVAMKHAIPAIYEYGFDPNSFIDPEEDKEKSIIYLIRTQISPNATAQLLRLLTTIISSLIPGFTIAHIESIGALLMDAVSGNIGITKDLAKQEDTILPPLFECINRFILLVGPEFQPFLENFVGLMHTFISGKNRTMKGYAIRALSTLTINFQDQEIAGPAIENALIGMSLSNVSLKTNSFNAIGFLIRSNREEMNKHSAEIIEAANEVLNEEASPEEVYEAALAAWCTLFVVFRIPVTAEQIVAAFQHLQFRTQSITRSSDHIVAFSKFMFYACSSGITGVDAQLSLVAAIALSSTDFEIARIGGEQCSFFASILAQNTDSIEELTCMNQRKARIILSRLPQ